MKPYQFDVSHGQELESFSKDSDVFALEGDPNPVVDMLLTLSLTYAQQQVDGAIPVDMYRAILQLVGKHVNSFDDELVAIAGGKIDEVTEVGGEDVEDGEEADDTGAPVERLGKKDKLSPAEQKACKGMGVSEADYMSERNEYRKTRTPKSARGS